jgi:hypothetical protein
VFNDKENCHKEDNKKGPLMMLSFHSRILLKWMMMTVGSNGMIVLSLCMVLCSRQTVMFAIWPLVQEKYPTCVKILEHLGRGSWEQMQTPLISYPDSLVFALVCSLFFLQHVMFYSSKLDSHSRLKISYADVTKCSPECTGRSIVNDPLSDLGLW